MKKLAFYGAVLIGLEIVVFRATNAGQLLTKGGSAASGVIGALEGRR